MSSTIHEASEHFNKAADSARRAAETGREGGGIVDDTLPHMQSIAEDITL